MTAPNAIDLERAIIGSCVSDAGNLAAVLGVISPEDFYDGANRLVFETIVEQFESARNVDLLTISQRLKERGSVIGADALAEMTSTFGSNVEEYAHVILEKSIQRRLASTCLATSEAAAKHDADALALLDRHQSDVLAIGQRTARKSAQPVGPVALQAVMQVEAGGLKGGVMSGYHDLDELTCGFQPSDLVIIAGETSQGKTALGVSIAKSVAKRGDSVGFFSLEMSTMQLTMRLLSSSARVDSNKLRHGRLTPEEHKRLAIAAHELEHLPLVIDETGAAQVAYIRAQAYRMRAERSVKLIIVDYLQLMSAGKTYGSREQEVSSFSRGLKAIAKELKVPVIALSQLNRGNESTSGKRPVLARLRESGAIEQDADTVIFVHRPEVYGQSELWNKEPSEGMAEVIVAKQRNGPTDTVKLAYLKEYTLFADAARSGQQETF